MRNGRIVHPRRQPAQDAFRETRHEGATNTHMSMRQSPDVGLSPRLPQVLGIFRRADGVIVDRLYQ
jgi:hypothetical protein